MTNSDDVNIKLLVVKSNLKAGPAPRNISSRGRNIKTLSDEIVKRNVKSNSTIPNKRNAKMSD